jgi:hypothetical protein
MIDPTPLRVCENNLSLMGQAYDGSIKKRLTGRLAKSSIDLIVKTWLKIRDSNATNCLETENAWSLIGSD